MTFPAFLSKISKSALLLILTLGVVACAQIVRHSGDDALLSPRNGALRLATYNVHYIDLRRREGPWSVADWTRRKYPLDLAFKTIDADLVAFQEMESFAGGSESRTNLALDWLLEQNPGYAAAAVGDPAVFPSTQPILYRKSRLRVVDQGWFFFSETPDSIYSRTFNGSYPAFASWARFTDVETGAKFRLINIHTDFGSRSNRLKSVALVAERIAPWIGSEETLFVAADLNARLGDRALRIIEATGVRFLPVSGATYHFNRGLNLFGAIDHIGHVGPVGPVGTPIVLRRKFGGEWPTDHYPVVADFRFLP